MSSSEDTAEALVDQLLSMLGERDVTSKAVIGFIAQFTATYPNKMLDQVFGFLDSTNTIQRRNALDILTEVFNINHKASQNGQLR
jgi:hypothetical protein